MGRARIEQKLWPVPFQWRGGELRRYEYPRYFFTNKSEDILGLFSAALDLVGVEWKITRRDGQAFNVSVS